MASSINMNDAVLLKGAIGVVLYMGPVEWDEDKSKTYVGLELSTQIPNGHNGTYHDHTYYECKAGHGVILPLTKIIRVLKPIELLRKLTELKRVLVQESLRNTITTTPSAQLSTANHSDSARVSIHGLLLNESIPSDKRLRKIQLLDNGNQVGTHCIVIPNHYIQAAPSPMASAAASAPREPVDSVSGSDLKPLVLKPLSNGSAPTSNRRQSNRRRSSISGRRYSVTARQGSMYEQWSSVMAPTMDGMDSILMAASMTECDAPSMKQCSAVQRVFVILQYFEEWTFKKSNKLGLSEVDRMIDFMDNLERYDVVKLLNDYYHLMDCHEAELHQR